MSTNNEAGERMTLPKAISDAIDAYQKAVSDCRTIRYTKFGKALRLMLQEHAASWLHTIDRDTLAAMLDEIEESRRIDARRLADAEHAFREECEAAAKEPSDWLKRCIWKQAAKEHLPSAIGVPIPPATWKPAGKDGGA